jgi:5'-nucleotidase / UDP-sugar diphosphatase
MLDPMLQGSSNYRAALIFLLALVATIATPFAPLRAAQVKLTLVSVNDFYEMSEGADGRGGFAKLAAVVKAERAAGKHVLFIHAGDTLSPSLMSGFDHGEHMIALFNEIPPDMFVPGNHEFDFGRADYQKRMVEARFPVLAANLRGPDGQPLPGHKDHMILDVEGVKVGFSGATLEESSFLSSPGDLKFAPVFSTLETQSATLKKEGADIVIAVTHSGLDDDWKIFRARLADVLFTGHTHDLRIEYDGKTVMVESSEDAHYVTVTELTIDKETKNGKTQVTWTPNFRIIDTATVKADAAMAAKVKVYEDELGKELDVPVAKLDASLDSHEALVRTSETAIGNLVADALRDEIGADVALTNGGGIRGDKAYSPGANLTRRDVLTELPFGNKVVAVKISGANLKAALENGFSQLPAAAGRFPQVSGMTVSVDPTKPTGSRVTTVTIGGKPLDLSATYTLATNDYLLRGGDGYGVLAKAEVIKPAESGLLIANDVMVLAKKLGHIAAKVEGRIVIK